MEAAVEGCVSEEAFGSFFTAINHADREKIVIKLEQDIYQSMRRIHHDHGRSKCWSSRLFKQINQAIGNADKAMAPAGEKRRMR
jgi:hypothetical protein